MTLEQLLALQDAGAQVLDTRDAAQFASGHLRGSINIGLVGQYATWAGTVLDPEKPIVIVADPGQESESALRLGRIGLDSVVGYLEGGFRSVDARPSLIVATERLTPELAAERMAARRSTARRGCAFSDGTGREADRGQRLRAVSGTARTARRAPAGSSDSRVLRRADTARRWRRA